MNLLSDILYKVSLVTVVGPLDRKVTAICTDSRRAVEGGLFIAIKGVHTDGQEFIASAIAGGCKTIVAEAMPSARVEDVTYIVVRNAAEAAGIIAANFYDNPTHQLTVVGVTGTNGKTTIATLLYKLFTVLGYRCGLVSTVQNMIAEKAIPSTHTTPDSIHLNILFRDMLHAGCTHVFMEVSSHALHQHRTAGVQFAGGIFSNITHDHLDYHQTFDEYIRVKKSFFDQLPPQAFALSNKDDKRGAVMLQNTAAKKNFYSLKTVADFKARLLDNDLNGLVLNIDEKEVHFRLIGSFNAYNLIAVYGAAVLLGEPKDVVLTALSNIEGAEGRFDYFVSRESIIAIVDYAHTPDALQNVLETIQKLRKADVSIITVVGCGGDRDKTKRPLMGEVACKLSDKVIFTSDNPRSESPDEILDNMVENLNSAARRKYTVITKREEAIKHAVSVANPGDIVLVAGKGHEKYQEIKGVKHPFDDKEVLKQMFELFNK